MHLLSNINFIVKLYFFIIIWIRTILISRKCILWIQINTIRKLINTNGNIEGIFPSVNFRGILPTKIFPRYIPRELPWEKKLKQSKKKWWRVIFTNGITDETNFVGDSVGKFAGKLWTLFIMSSTKGITDGKFRRYCPDSKSLTDWKVVGVIWRFSEKIQLI
jgi:hypothetical protein